MSKCWKGGDGERVICRILTTWITGKEKPEILWRSATSGGKATQSGIKQHTMLGDLVSVDRRSAFLISTSVIEVKNRASTNVLDLLCTDAPTTCTKISKGNKTNGRVLEKKSLYCWWIKLTGIAESSNKKPILFFKRFQSRDWFVVFNTKDFNKLRVLSKFTYPIMSVNNKYASCSIINLKHFVEAIPVDVFKQCFSYYSKTPLKYQRFWNAYELDPIEKRCNI